MDVSADILNEDLPGGSAIKNLPANEGDAGDVGSMPGSRRFPQEGNGNPLQYSCLGNPMGGGALWATALGVSKSQTQLSNFTFTFLFMLLS